MTRMVIPSRISRCFDRLHDCVIPSLYLEQADDITMYLDKARFKSPESPKETLTNNNPIDLLLYFPNNISLPFPLGVKVGHLNF